MSIQNHNNSAENVNQCPICMSSLADDMVGVVVPCGHCLHMHCWDDWMAHCHGRSKCPMCNTYSSNFIRLYVELGVSCKEDYIDSDDSSVETTTANSTSNELHDSTDMRSQDSTERLNVDGEVISNDPFNQNHAAEIITIDDDDDDEHHHRSSNDNNMVATKLRKAAFDKNDLEASTKKYKIRARLLKKCLFQLQLEQKQYETEKQKQAERLRECENNLSTQEELLVKADNESKAHMREREYYRLTIAELRREVTDMKRKVVIAQTNEERRKEDMNKLEIIYRQKLKQTESLGINEFKRITQQHPKLIEENRKLKEQLQRMSSSSLSSGQSKNIPHQNKSSKAMLRSLDEGFAAPIKLHIARSTTKQISTIRSNNQSESIATKLHSEESNLVKLVHSTKLSAHAVRMSRNHSKIQRSIHTLGFKPQHCNNDNNKLDQQIDSIGTKRKLSDLHPQQGILHQKKFPFPNSFVSR